MATLRIKRASALLEEHAIDALIVDDPVDLFYLTGLALSSGRLVIEKEKVCLYVDGRYINWCQKHAPVPVLQGTWEGQGRVGFDTALSYEKFSKLGGTPVPLEAPIKRLRMLKESEEIAAIRKATQLAEMGVDFVVAYLKEGVSEKHVAAELEIFWRQKGGERLAFDPIVAFGAHGAHPHYRASDGKLAKGDLILIDVGVVLGEYHSDLTRVFSWGETDPELVKIYEIVRKAQEAALVLCRPGTPLKELDKAARVVITEAGYGEAFTHSLGHGVGLEVHELPALRATAEGVLEAGMVITIEPGIYLPGKGGVRIEEMVAITESGFDALTTPPSNHLVSALR